MLGLASATADSSGPLTLLILRESIILGVRGLFFLSPHPPDFEGGGNSGSVGVVLFFSHFLSGRPFL